MIKDTYNKFKFYFQRQIRNQGLRNSVTNRIANDIGKGDFPNDIGKELSIDSNEISKQGYSTLGKFLTDNEVDNLKEKVSSKLKCYNPFDASAGMFGLNEIPDQVHVANYRREDLCKHKEILDIANNTSILNAVQDFLGAKPTISNINMWWSIPGKKQAQQAQLFHRDVDDYKFCKFFIYLTDVKMDGGPHVYVEGSSQSEKLRKIRRYQDEEIIGAFGEESIKYFTASKGSAFLVDTYGFHKGLLPEKETRLLLQVQYSLNPIGIEKYKPIDVGAHKYDKYVNRLILK